MSTLDSPGGSRRLGSAPAPTDDTVEIPPLDGNDPRDLWERTQAGPEFQALRRSLRRFAFPVTAAFLAWYLLYLLMSDYARGFMDTKLLGNINVAYVFGLLQFVSTFVIAYLYARYAQKHLDPAASALRKRLEGDR